MIQSYRDKRTEAFANGEVEREFHGIARQAFKRLELLDAETSLRELRQLPSNRLEALRGDRSGQFSININDQYRLCFIWQNDAAGSELVEIIDYH